MQKLKSDRQSAFGAWAYAAFEQLYGRGGLIFFAAVVSRLRLLAALILLMSIVSGCSDQKKQAESLVRVALQHRDANRHLEAIQNLNRALALNPKLSEAWYLRGLSHAALKHSRESIADLTTATRLNPKWDEAWLALGVAQRASGETALAIKSFSEAIRLDSHLVAAWFDRACAYAEMGEPALSLQDLDTVLRLSPDHDEALICHARALQNSRPDEAIHDLSSVLSRNRDNAEAWMLRGLCWHLANDSDRALADLNTACRLKPDDYRPWLERGRVLRMIKRYEDAISDLSTAVKLGSSVADCHFEMAMACRDSGDIPAAEASLRQALTLDPDHSKSLLAQASLSAGRGDHVAALKTLEKISTIRPVSESDSLLTERVRLERARALAATGNTDQALQELALFMDARPSDTDALQLRAEIFASLNRSEEAVADYTRLIASGSNTESYLLKRAELHMSAQRWDEALQDLSTILDQNSESSVALAVRARVYEHQGKHGLAVADLTSALKVKPDSVELLLQRATLFGKLGESVAAITDLQRVVELQPNDDVAVLDLVLRLQAENKGAKALALLNRLWIQRGNTLPAALLILRGELRLQSGDISGAEEELTLVQEPESRSLSAELLRVRIAIARNQDSQALARLNALAEHDVTAEVYLLRGQILARQGQFIEASAALTQCLDLDLKNVDALEARAIVYADLQDWKNALADSNAVLELKSPAPLSRTIRGISLFRLRHYRDAIEDLESQEVRESDTASVQWMRCQCLIELDQKFRAREELNSLLENHPAHEQARLLRAKLAEQHGEFDVAIDDLSSVIARQPENDDVILQRGLMQHRRGQFAAAIDDFTRVLSMKPASAEVHYRRGLALHQLQQTSPAIEDLDECLKLNPEFAEAAYVKGNIEASLGHIETAVRLYQQAVEIAPDHAAAWYNQGNLLFNDGKLGEATECWSKAIEHQPNLFRAYNNRAAAYAKLNRMAEAVSDYEKAIELSPGFARAWDNYAWLLATSADPVYRDPTRAVFMAKKACELTNYSDWTCISTLAGAYAEAGDMKQAAVWARKSKVLAPDDQKSEIEKLVQTYEAQLAPPKNFPTATRTRNSVRQ